MTPVPGTHTSGIHVIRVGNVGGKASGWCAHARREELGGAVGGRVRGLVRPGRGEETPASVRAASRRERSPYAFRSAHSFPGRSLDRIVFLASLCLRSSRDSFERGGDSCSKEGRKEDEVILEVAGSEKGRLVDWCNRYVVFCVLCAMRCLAGVRE